MGIGDRAYMQNTIPFHQRISATLLTLCILLGFYIVTLVGAATHSDFTSWALLPEIKPTLWQWLTYGLIHYDFWHLLGNAFGLWWLGKIVEERWGERIFYLTLAGGVLLGAAFWWLTGLAGVRGENHSLVGISGGVYALMMVALIDQLDTEITLLLFFILPIKIRVRWFLIFIISIAVLGWLFSELPGRHDWATWKPVSGLEGGNPLAHSAHLGGLIFGWLTWKYLQRTNLASGDAYSVMSTTPSNHQSPQRDSGKSPKSIQARQELDRLLDKISAEGFGSLTEVEKRKLATLSEQLK